MTTDWQDWHSAYADPASSLSRRLLHVQQALSDALDRAPVGRVRLVSACAGQGHDVIGVLSRHARRCDVSGTLVEYDVDNAAAARRGVDAAGLEGLDVVVGDAGMTDAYIRAVPAHVVLMCGVFGNIPDADVERTVRWLPMLCAARATVIWTRHRREPDLTPAIRDWFAAAGFAEESFVAPPDAQFSVGAHVLSADPVPLQPGIRLFAFS